MLSELAYLNDQIINMLVSHLGEGGEISHVLIRGIIQSFGIKFPCGFFFFYGICILKFEQTLKL